MWQHELICYRKYIAKVIYNKQFAKTRHNHELFARNPYYVGIRKSTTFTHIWIKVENSILALESGSSPGFSSLGSLVAVSLMGSASIKKITNSHDMFWAIKILVTAEDWVMSSVLNIGYRRYTGQQNYVPDTGYRVIYRDMVLNTGWYINSKYI